MQFPRDSWPPFRSEPARRSAMIALYVLVLLVAVAEVLRALGRMEGVIFGSYVDVGEAVLRGTDPYALTANTWPPFFLIESVPLALLARISPALALASWQVLGLFAIWGVVKLSVAFFEDGPISFWPRDGAHLAFISAAVIVPFLMTARIFDEHVQHTQINVQVLFLVLWAFHCFRRGRPVVGGLWLALAASTKAVPILLLGYLLYKRCWREARWTVAWLLILNVGLLGVVFGPTHLWELWMRWRMVAGTELLDPTPTFMNQSLLAALKRLLTVAGGARDPVAYNVAAWSAGSVRVLFLGVIALAAGALAWLFRGHWRDLTGRRAAAELAICLGAMVVVDPLAWKAHYVTLIAAYAFCWWAMRRGASRWEWGLWWGSLLCVSGSAAALWGGRVSHVLESYDVILVGAGMVLVLGAVRISQERRTDGQTDRDTTIL